MAKKWTYDENTDYQALINDAVGKKDYAGAARYEQQRNAKIADMDAAGTNKWNAVATNNYSQYLMPEGFQGSTAGVGVNNPAQGDIREQMRQNSLAWWDASPEERERLHKQNEYFSSLLGGDIAYDPAKGTWEGDAGLADAAGNLVSGGEMAFNFRGEKPTWSDPYQEQIDQVVNNVLNRDPFSYNYLEDPLYQQYAETYMREGNRAMNDTLASMASGAGGMNSYAQGAAQQAQNYYAAQLGDKIPELHQLAYQMYLDDIGLQREDLSMLQGLSDTQYGRYRDDVGDYYKDYDYAYGAYWDEKSFDYGAGRDQIADDRYNKEREYETGIESQDRARAELDAILAAGGTPSEELIKASGYSPEYIAAMQALYAPQGGGSYNPGVTWGSGYDTEQGADGVKASEWGYVKNNFDVLLRNGNISAADYYMDLVVDDLSKEQYEEIQAMYENASRK